MSSLELVGVLFQSIALIGLVCMAVGIFYRPRLTRLAQKLVRKWADYKIPSWYVVKEFFVYFLDAKSELQHLTADQFLKMHWPETERPRVWLCYLELANSNRAIYLGWQEEKKWHFSVFTSIDGSVELIDQHNKKLPIGKNDNCLKRIQNILQLVSQYDSVDEYTLKTIADYAIPMLEKTKETMGKSPPLANIRVALTLGSGIFRFEETVDFDRLQHLVP